MRQGNRQGNSDAVRLDGFSLIELLVVVALIAVLLGVAAPAFVDTVRDNRLRTELFALRATLNNARSEALARRMPVFVCETANSTTCSSTGAWTAGFLAYADADGDSAPDPNEVFIARQIDGTDDMSLIFRNAGGAAASNTLFSAQGDALNNSGTFTLCDARGASEARALILENSGAVRTAEDTDSPENAIVNDLDDNDVTCPAI